MSEAQASGVPGSLHHAPSSSLLPLPLQVRVFRFISVSPIEERILAAAQDKTNMNAFVIEAGDYAGSKDDAAAAAAGDEPAAGGGGGGGKRKFIAEILAADLEAAGGGAGRGESLVEDDEALNELMARDEAEFKRLQVKAGHGRGELHVHV